MQIHFFPLKRGFPTQKGVFPLKRICFNLIVITIVCTSNANPRLLARVEIYSHPQYTCSKVVLILTATLSNKPPPPPFSPEFLTFCLFVIPHKSAHFRISFASRGHVCQSRSFPFLSLPFLDDNIPQPSPHSPVSHKGNIPSLRSWWMGLGNSRVD